MIASGESTCQIKQGDKGEFDPYRKPLRLQVNVGFPPAFCQNYMYFFFLLFSDSSDLRICPATKHSKNDLLLLLRPPHSPSYPSHTTSTLHLVQLGTVLWTDPSK